MQISSSVLILRKMRNHILTALRSIFTCACHATSWPVCDFSLLISKGLIDLFVTDCFTFISRICSILFAQFMYFFVHFKLLVHIQLLFCLCIYRCCSACAHTAVVHIQLLFCLCIYSCSACAHTAVVLLVHIQLLFCFTVICCWMIGVMQVSYIAVPLPQQ